MHFDISSLPAGGAARDSALSLDPFEWEGGGTVEAEKLHLSGRFRPTRHGWELSGTLSGQVSLDCTRCLSRFTEPLRVEFRLLLTIPEELAAERGEQFDPLDEDDPEAVDLFPLQGATLDLAAVAREQIDLALPYRALCREECRGLCSHCGADLNKTPCDCGVEMEAGQGDLVSLKEKLLKARERRSPERS